MPIEIDGQLYYRTAEVYRTLGISRNTLYRWLQKDILGDSERRDIRGWRLFTRTEIETLKESILNKPSRLTEEEFRHVQEHSKTGERILAPIVDDEKILSLVRSHHERYNGAGYPDGLKGTQIELGAKILALADAFEAMTSERPYRKAMSEEAAIAELKRCEETQFDPEVVDAFLRCKRKWRMREDTGC